MFRKTIFKPERKKDLDETAKMRKPLLIAQTFAKMQGYQVIAPAKLAKDGKFANLDFILVGYFGVLGVKCIGLNGEIYGSAGDNMWLQVKPEKRVSFVNPLKEAQNDVRVIRDTLFTAKLKSVPIETVCVFTHPYATLALPRSTGHYTIKEFKALLGKDHFVQDKRVNIEETVAAIKVYVKTV